MNEIQTWEFATPCEYDNNIKTASYYTTSVYGFGHPLYYQNVIDVCADLPNLKQIGEKVSNLGVLTAVYIAARDGKTVGLHLKKEQVII